MTGFKTIHIYNANKKKWTLKTVRELIRDVKADFRHDGYELEIDFKYESFLLEINCRIRKPDHLLYCI
jgi:hypothetical protein